MSQNLRRILELLHSRLEQLGFTIDHSSSEIVNVSINQMSLSIHWQQVMQGISEWEQRDEGVLVEEMLTKILTYVNPSKDIAQYFPRWLPWIEHKATNHPWTISVVERKLDLSIVAHKDGHFTWMSPLKVIAHPTGLRGLKNEAMQNLNHLSKNVELEQMKDGLWIWESLEGMAASMLLVPHLLPKGEFWVGIPTRDHLWICTNEKWLPELQIQVLQAYQELPHAIVGQVFSWRQEHSQEIQRSWWQ